MKSLLLFLGLAIIIGFGLLVYRLCRYAEAIERRVHNERAKRQQFIQDVLRKYKAYQLDEKKANDHDQILISFVKYLYANEN